MNSKCVLITGAAGNLGTKLRQHLHGRHELRLLDRETRGDPDIYAADLSRWDDAWIRLFAGVDTIFHFAANPVAHHSWPELVGPNLDALVNVFLAAARAGVRRVVYASSNHVLGGYHAEAEVRLTPALMPRPGARYVVEGQQRDSTPYGSAKLFGERLGKGIADAYGISVLAVRLGWVRPGDNRASELPAERGDWFRLMWLSNRDFCRLMECCLNADPALRFAVLHGMSRNRGMRWDLEETQRLVGYEPMDDVTLG